MSGLLEDILAKLESIESIAHGILHMQPISGTTVIVTGLDDISTNLGLVKAGEFRSGTGEPGSPSQPFTGIRMGAPGWTYSGTRYSIVGLNNDVLQFGLSNEDGKIYAGAGVVQLDSNGIRIVGDGTDTEINRINFYYDDSGTMRNMGDILATASSGNPLYMTMRAWRTSTSPWSSANINIAAQDSTTTPSITSYLQIEATGSVTASSKRFQVITRDIVDLTSELDAYALWVDGPTRTYDTGARSQLVATIFDPPTWVADAASNITARSATLFIDGAPTLTNFTATRNYGLITQGGAWIEDGGLDLATGIGASDGDMCYSGDLQPYRNSTVYTGYAFVPLTTPLTSTSWDGDAKDATANGTLDLSTVFSAPAGIKAVAVSLEVVDETADVACMLGPSATQLGAVTAHTIVANTHKSSSGVVPCDANGDFYIFFEGEMDAVTLKIWGYWI